jgi:hypothetical protein
LGIIIETVPPPPRINGFDVLVGYAKFKYHFVTVYFKVSKGHEGSHYLMLEHAQPTLNSAKTT